MQLEQSLEQRMRLNEGERTVTKLYPACRPVRAGLAQDCVEGRAVVIVMQW
jgi:hypothetical protein